MNTTRVRKAHQNITVNGVRYHVTLDGLCLGFRQFKRSRTHWLSLSDLAEVATGQLHLNQVAEAKPPTPPPIAAKPPTPPPVIAADDLGMNPYAPSKNPMNYGHRYGSD